MSQPRLIDRFGRVINYVRLSVTDRCDFRCVYCMSEDMTFLPRQQVLTLEEIAHLARSFHRLGVDKVRLTGGEPLVRRDLLELVAAIGELGLRDFAMTTNGGRLAQFADSLAKAGLKRVNISLDSLDEGRFHRITRTGRLSQVIDGIDAACAAGFERVKLNVVVMKGRNDDEIPALVNFARQRDCDISFIEEMPLGVITEHDRAESFCSSAEVRAGIERNFPLFPTTGHSGGPARYYRMADSEIRVGFISPHSHNFCGDCNRVRVTAEGRLLLCLGNEHAVDLRQLMRRYPGDRTRLEQALIAAMDKKPERHHFDLSGGVQIVRFMNMTGG